MNLIKGWGMVALAHHGELLCPVRVQKKVIPHEAGETSSLEPYLQESNKKSVEQLFKALCDEIRAKGEDRKTWEAMVAKQRLLKEGSVFASRSDEALPGAKESGGGDVPI